MFNVRKQKNLCNLFYMRENKTIKSTKCLEYFSFLELKTNYF